jgi:hypothetical protein
VLATDAGPAGRVLEPTAGSTNVVVDFRDVINGAVLSLRVWRFHSLQES